MTGDASATAPRTVDERYEWLPDAVAVVGSDGRITSANSLLARLLGVDLGRLAGQRADEWLRLVDESGADWWRCAQPFDADPGLLPRIPERPLSLTTASGRTRPVLLAGSRVDDGTGRLAFLVLTLRRAERRQRLDAARSELISTVSHELRSPLTSVKGFTKTLLAKWDRFSDDQKRQMLATMNADADRVTRLLTDLLDVSRIDAGRLRLSRRMVAVAHVIEPLAERLRANQGAPVDVSLPPGLPDLYADPDKLAQVFTNLLENAHKYGRGTIRVSAHVGSRHVSFTVADQGGAVDVAQLPLLFTKFFRRAGLRQSGTGLGLYISRGIVEAHGGRMWAETDAGRETRFCFTLPRGGLELAGVSPAATAGAPDGT